MNTYETIKSNNNPLKYYSNYQNKELEINTAEEVLSITEKSAQERIYTQKNKTIYYTIIQFINIVKNKITNQKYLNFQGDLSFNTKAEAKILLNPDNNITSGYIDLHSLKGSTKKTNGIYRIDIIDGLYSTYITLTYISRKGTKSKLTSYSSKEKGISSQELDYIIYKFTNTINNYQSKNGKPETSFNFYLTPIIEKEKQIIEELKLIAEESYSNQNKKDLHNFINKYSSPKTLQRNLTKN